MNTIASIIADMVRAGVDPDLIGRTAEAFAAQQTVAPIAVMDEQAERRRERDRERKRDERLRKSAEVCGHSDITPLSPLPDKEKSPTPPKEINPSPLTPQSTVGAPVRRACRIGDFQPDLAVGVGLGLSQAQAAIERDKFRDFWTAKSGANATKLDWPATWRNWCRSALDRLSRASGPPQGRRTASHAFMELAREQKKQESPYDNLVDFSESLRAPRLISG